jgi:hypothetical protein
MKHSLSLSLFALAALVCGSTFAQAPRAQDSEVSLLKRDVARLQAEVAQLKEAAAPDGGTDLQEVVEYLQSQAKGAEQLQKMLADAEDKGFTYGINPDSRVAILQGFNQFVNTLQADVPGAPKDGADDAGQ